MLRPYGLNELREMFLAFFEEKKHLRLSSFPLVPQNDASLLLINSGMAPMKTWFTGEQEPPCRRVCTCQKSIRTIDIDSVGKTARHASYFEMLGNFSFGDYFKKDAILWCWEFLTKRLGIDPNVLYPSVYVEDEEAFNIWKNEVGISEERIVRLGKEDNFWDHGSGPCGPCSEVYFDRGSKYGCGNAECFPGCDCDRFVEVWNNVFTQYDNDGQGNYTELSQKNIDTGMGLERLACVCQGVSSIFEVDTIVSIINKVSEISGISYGKSVTSDISIRIITDHIRASTMMICDGVLPSNEGRGYVLRRLLRRASRNGRLLGIEKPFLGEICDVVISQNKTAYPDLTDKAKFIKRCINTEEENFGKTINAGLSMLGDLIKELESTGKTVLSGEDAFKLYDTYGFPLDLTVDILTEHNKTVDTDAFENRMKEQRTRARKAREALGDLAWAGLDLGLDNTPTVFTGYEKTNDTGCILAIVKQEEICSALRSGDEGIIVLDKTPFYAEKGGQVTDMGFISAGEAVFEVKNVQLSKAEKYLHHGKMISGILSVDDTVELKIDDTRRSAIKRAHTAAHLMHKALRDVLGEHVNQAGSFVEPDRLRFDFTHFSALTKEEIADIEHRVNNAILDGCMVDAKETPIEQAKKLGAAALFGEKYGEIVRVVTMGESVEFCGGTHLDNTAKVGAFAILTEASISSGVRRIEAVTGIKSLELLRASRKQLSALSEMLKAGTPEELTGKIEQNLSIMRELRSKLDSALSKEAGDDAGRLLAEAREIKGLKVITTVIKGANVDIDKLRQIEDTLREWEAGVVAVIAAVGDEKITIMVACGKMAIEKGIKAGELIREITKICGGSGGGKPEFAMGGGKDINKLQDALDAVDDFVKEIIN